MRLGDLPDRLVLQVRLALAQRGPRLGDDPVPGVQLPHGLLGEVRVQLDLVCRGNHTSVQDVLQSLLREVRDADGAGLAGGLDLLERPPGVQVLALLRLGPVDEVQVHVVQAQALQGLVHGLQGGLVALVVVPQLGGDEQLLARDAAAGDRAPHTFLVAVDLGGVDVAVADLQGLAHHVFGNIRVHLPHAEAELGDRVAVVELQGLVPGHVRQSFR